jgi:hypothetical protein
LASLLFANSSDSRSTLLSIRGIKQLAPN